jgi:lipoprotein-releasing system permease protein
VKKPFSLFLALRYLKPKRTFISVITLISILGVTLGITVLILVISVMTGFEHELRKKVLGFDAHIVVRSHEGLLENWQPLMKKIVKLPNVEAAAPFAEGPVIIEFNGQVKPTQMRGISLEKEQAVVKEFKDPKFIKYGAFDLSGDNAVIGSDLAEELNLHVGDKISVLSPKNKQVMEALKRAKSDPKALEEAVGHISLDDLTITGIFETGRYEFDSYYMLVPLYVGQELYDLNDSLHGISVRTSDPDNTALLKKVQAAIQEGAPEGVYAQTWEERNASLFQAIDMERKVMFFLLMFIIIVAAFCIMNTLITVTVQKTREIGIMKALGATTGQIVSVFLGQGMVVGFFGNLSGIALGITLITYRNEFKDWLSLRLGIHIFPADIYQFSQIPAEVVWWPDVTVICISAFAICSLAALVPAYVAARLDPVKALRQE